MCQLRQPKNQICLKLKVNNNKNLLYHLPENTIHNIKNIIQLILLFRLIRNSEMIKLRKKVQKNMYKKVKSTKATINNQIERVADKSDQINKKYQVLNLNLIIRSQEKGLIITIKCQWTNLIKSTKFY